MRTLARVIRTLTLVIPMVLPSAWAAEPDRDFSDAELDRMLAPVALYPDTVLSHVLIAATYPLEVVEAARWSRRHPDLRGEEAVAAVENEDWDASVKALVAFPELLARMDDDLDWTEDLGNAFLAQEEIVADRVQVLRQRAYDAGHLNSLEHVRVIREPEVITIEPTVTRVVYVPYYDTRVVYGSWWWPAFPPVYWAFPHGHHASSVWYWGLGFHVAPTFYYSSWHWHQRRVVVVRDTRHHHHFHSDRAVARHHEARPWRHEASHRRGVDYRHERVRREYASAHTSRPDRRDHQHNERGPRDDGENRWRVAPDNDRTRDEHRTRDAARPPRHPDSIESRLSSRESERHSSREEREAHFQSERPARREARPEIIQSEPVQREEPRPLRSRDHESDGEARRGERNERVPQREPPTSRPDRNDRGTRPSRGNSERGNPRQRTER